MPKDTNNAGNQHVVAYIHHDVWSYGLIAYEMLTSQAPFPSDADGKIVLGHPYVPRT